MYLCRDITFSYLSTNIPPNKPSSLIIVTITLRLMSVSVFRRSPIDEALFINKSTTQKSLQNVFPENLFVLSKTYYNAYNSWLLSQFQILSKCTPSLGNTFQKKKKNTDAFSEKYESLDLPLSYFLRHNLFPSERTLRKFSFY